MANNELVYRAVRDAIASGENTMDDIIEDVDAAFDSEIESRMEDGQRATNRTALGVEVATAAGAAKALATNLRHYLED